MKQIRLWHGFWYRKRYIPACDYTIVDDPLEHCQYLTGLEYGNIPISIKITPGLKKEWVRHETSDFL